MALAKLYNAPAHSGPFTEPSGKNLPPPPIQPMQSVYLDQEKVEFSGPPPADLNAILALINVHLQNQGRTLSSLKVDGKEYIKSDAADYPRQYTCLEFESLDLRELFSGLIHETLESCRNTPQELRLFAAQILMTPWTEVLAKIDRLIEKISPIIELSESLKQYIEQHDTEWKNSFLQNASTLNTELAEFIDAARNTDVARVSDIVAHGLAPLISSFLTLAEIHILPGMEEGLNPSRS